MTFYTVSIAKLLNNRNSDSKSDQGAITVEYALTMVIATGLMLGVEFMFRELAFKVIQFFENLVMQFPNL